MMTDVGGTNRARRASAPSESSQGSSSLRRRSRRSRRQAAPAPVHEAPLPPQSPPTFWQRWARQHLPFVQVSPSLATASAAAVAVGLFMIALGTVAVVFATRLTIVEVGYSGVSKYSTVRLVVNLNVSWCTTVLRPWDVATPTSDLQGPPPRIYRRADGTTEGQGLRSFVPFTVPRAIEGPAVMFYKLSGFHLGMHRYQAAKRNWQLLGQSKPLSDGSPFSDNDCYPLASPGDRYRGAGASSDPSTVTGVVSSLALNASRQPANVVPYSRFRYVPCGTVPWSMFNDSFVVWSRQPTEPGGTTAFRGVVACDTSEFDAEGSAAPSRSWYGPIALIPPPPSGYSSGDRTPRACAKDGVLSPARRASMGTPAQYAENAQSVPVKYRAPTSATSGGGAASASSSPAWAASDLYVWSSRNTWTEGLGTDNEFFQQSWYVNEAGHRVPQANDTDLLVWSVPPTASGSSGFLKPLRRFPDGIAAGQYVLQVDELFPLPSGSAKAIVFMTAASPWGSRNTVLGGAGLAVGIFLVISGLVFLSRDAHREFMATGPNAQQGTDKPQMDNTASSPVI